MKKFLKVCLFFIFFVQLKACSTTILGGVSVIEQVPQELFGSWAVSAVQSYTNNPKKYNSMPSLDYWNIYKHDNVLTLENPQSGARASVKIKEVVNNTVSFTRQSKKTESEVTETPTITILGENFVGTDKMVIKNYKNGSLISTDVVEFMIRGQKIGGIPAAKLLK